MQRARGPELQSAAARGSGLPVSQWEPGTCCWKRHWEPPSPGAPIPLPVCAPAGRMRGWVPRRVAAGTVTCCAVQCQSPPPPDPPRYCPCTHHASQFGMVSSLVSRDALHARSRSSFLTGRWKGSQGRWGCTQTPTLTPPTGPGHQISSVGTSIPPPRPCQDPPKHPARPSTHCAGSTPAPLCNFCHHRAREFPALRHCRGPGPAPPGRVPGPSWSRSSRGAGRL